MLKRVVILAAISMMVLGGLPGCGGAPAGDPEPSDEVALEVTGNVASEMAWTEEEVRAMDSIEAERENSEGELSTYTGVPIRALLEEAGASDSASTVTFIAEDDSTADVDLAEVMACDNCIVSFRNRGGFSIVMPGYRGTLQVKGVVEIQVE